MTKVKETSTQTVPNEFRISINNDEYPDTGRYLTPFQRKLLEKSCQNPHLSEQYRQRLQIMLLADEGKNQAEICQLLGCCHGTARHWILMARTGQAHNWHLSPVGRPKAVNEQYLERLKELISQSPKECGYSFNRWTAKWLSKQLEKELGIEISDRHINRLLKQMGLSTRTKPFQVKSGTSSRPQPNSTFKIEGNRILISDLSSQPNPETTQIWSSQSVQTLNHR